MIMTKGIFETYTPAGNFLLPLSNCLYHYFSLHCDIAYFAYMVSPHGYHTSGITSRFEPDFIYKVTLLNDE